MKEIPLWIRIFHVRPDSIGETRFLFGEKFSFGKVEVATYLFYFKKENKTREKTLKKWLYSF